MISIQQFQTS